ncbi:MAG: hypothetical protein VW551_07415 [Euryarchaeota archaeon]|jgi:hypothetical protein
MPDIDIDFADRDIILSKIQHRVAKLDSDKKHNTGVYVTEIPHNPIDKLSTIEHKTAEERGYFKLDFLNVSIYKDVRDEQHLQELLERTPEWTLLQHKEFSDLLFHVNGHENILQTLKPSSVEQLAAVLAIIRPAKRHLVNESWEKIMQEVWIKPDNGEYYFKKAHAMSYAFAVVVHMNLLCEQVNS